MSDGFPDGEAQAARIEMLSVQAAGQIVRFLLPRAASHEEADAIMLNLMSRMLIASLTGYDQVLPLLNKLLARQGFRVERIGGTA
jgi:hypothetical protein